MRRQEKRSRVDRKEAVSTKTTARTIVNDWGEPSCLTELLAMPEDALDSEDEEKDPTHATFDLDSSMKEDENHMRMDTFNEEWASHLDRDDGVSLVSFSISS